MTWPGRAPLARRDPADTLAVRRTLAGDGHPLDATIRSHMESRFGQDFSQVRVHAGSTAGASAREMGAVAWTRGRDMAFAPGAYSPRTAAGRDLIAHELAHVAQQTRGGGGAAGAAHEAEADRAASAVLAGRAAPSLSAVAPSIQRKVIFRDVGKGEQSGFGRLGEIITKLNKVSTALTFSVDAKGVLSYEEDPYETPSDFDNKMKGFVDSAADIPLRLTNRHGLLRSAPAGSFDARVDADAWASGYVDVDDMLGSDDLGFQIVLVHFLTERAATKNYAKRIGTLDDTSAEFTKAHNKGVQAEVEVLRDFFKDPGIKLIADGGTGGVFRSYRTSRGDTIRARTPPAPKGQPGLDINLVDVRLKKGGTIMSANDYKALLERERAEAAAAEDAAAKKRLLELKGSPQVGPDP